MGDTDVLVSYEDSLQIITLNRPHKKNALTAQMFSIVIKALRSAAENEQIKITLVTGAGDYFTSGADFGSSVMLDEDKEKVVRSAIGQTGDFIRAIMDYPKILIALVNGPAIGLGTTILCLFDLVYATDKVTFQTPFTSLGLSAEGCSSYTFPRTFGKSLAAKMLYFNYKMSAREAKDCGFVADILTEDQIPQFMNDLKKLTESPIKSLMYTKQLLRNQDIKALHYANAMELERLVELFQSEDFMNAILSRILMKKHKL